MPEKFSTLKEIIDYAVEKEKEAKALYTEAAEKSENKASKEIFKKLADMEAAHEKKLSAMDLDSLGADKGEKIRDLHISEFLKEMALKPDADFQSTLIFAMKREEHSRDFYRQMADSYAGTEAGTVLRKLAEEEQKHKYMLEQIYDDEILNEN